MKAKHAVIISVIVIAIAAAAAFYVMDTMQHRPQPVVAEPNQDDSMDKGDSHTLPGADPCGGTGGTGQIVHVENNSITIRRGNGTNVIIYFTDQTTFQTSAGAATKSDLKTGERVTVVVDINQDGSGTATTVLVCK